MLQMHPVLYCSLYHQSPTGNDNIRQYIMWQWRHSVCNIRRRHVGGILRCHSL